METPRTAARRDRIVTAIAWCVLLALTAFVASRQAHREGRDEAAATVADLQGRLALGTRALLPVGPGQTESEIDALDRGAPGLRQRAVVLAGETAGVAAAHARLARFETEAQAAGGSTAEIQRILNELFPATVPPGETQAARVARLKPSDRDVLVAGLGWFGRLALAPDGADAAARAEVLSSARRTATAGLAFSGAFCISVLGGITLWVIALVQVLRGRFVAHHRLEPEQRSHGAETYAAWLVVFLGLTVLAGHVARGSPWIAVLVADVAALGVLAVPVLRGVPWTTLRRRLGIHRGRGVVREMVAGVAGLVAAVPVVIGCALAAMALQTAAGHRSGLGEGAHPIVQVLTSAPPGRMALLFVLMSVMAPLVEETMFRGVLFGHLREATSRWPRVASVLVSAAVSSLLFAADHPQGWTAIPALGSLAAVLCLVREWRGSLIAPMVMHGLWNGAIGLFAAVALSS